MKESKHNGYSKTTNETLETKHLFLQQAGLPDNFSMEKLDRVLNAFFHIMDYVDHLSQYVGLLERIGVLSYEDGSTVIMLLRPTELLVRQHIKDRLDECKINVDEIILSEIVSAPSPDNIAPSEIQKTKQNLVLLKDK